ncbi:hypothetical protein BUE67_15655, partial [Corynebacterium diphtheriae]
EATGIKYEHEDGILHPVEIINTMQKTLTDDTTVTVDVGSHYIWMARKFRSYNPRHLLFEATGIKYEHEDGILHPVEIINTMQKTLTDDTT